MTSSYSRLRIRMFELGTKALVIYILELAKGIVK
jgi:hypothetical protein